MRPFVRFFSSELSGMGVRVWARLARLSFGPTPIPAPAPGSTPELGAGAQL